MPDWSEVTFGITHFMRDEELAGCVRSIQRHVPRAKIDTQDTHGNLSWGRNQLIDRCETPVYFMLEEDMRLYDAPELLVNLLLYRKDLLGVSGGLNEFRKMRAMAANFKRTPRIIHMVNSDRLRYFHETPYLLCDATFNFGAFRADRLREIRWDERLELAEHFEFFSRSKWPMACAPYRVRHRRKRGSEEYRERRRQLRFFRGAEKRIAGGTFVRESDWDAWERLQEPPKLDAVRRRVAAVQKQHRDEVKQP